MKDLLLILKNVMRKPFGERGAVLPMLGGAMFVLLGAGALAVDMSSLASQGQSLQNAADAAALAGVAEWVDSGNQTAANTVIFDVMNQNGYTNSGDIIITPSYPDPYSVQVNVVDTAPQVFLGQLVGYGDAVDRRATAEFTPCDPGCTSVTDVPEPAQGISYNGTGDGYRPIVLGDKVYAVRHHDNWIGCVDRTTNTKCWASDQRFFPSPSDYNTFNTTHPVIVGTKIYSIALDNGRGRNEYARTARDGFNNGNLMLTCWETATDSPCGSANTKTIASERTAILAGTANGLFVFTSNHRAYCFDPVTLDNCNSTYNSGAQTASHGMFNSQYASMRNSTFREHNGLIYFTVGNTQQTRGGQHQLQCWDSNFHQPCSGWGVHAVNSDSADSRGDLAIEGRLFFTRDTTGTPTAICSTGKGTGNSTVGANRVDCHDLVLGTAVSVSSSFDAFVNTFGDMTTASSNNGAWTSSAGQHTYHKGTNRTFFLGQHNDNLTYCWDWDSTSGSCGALDRYFHTNDPRPYGYWPTTECLFGLGHFKKFFTLTPDLTPGCLSGNLIVGVGPCMCGTDLLWPEVTARDLEEVDVFNVRVLDIADNQIFPPPDPLFPEGTWVDLADPLQTLDLAAVMGTSTTPIKIEAIVRGTGDSTLPWDDGTFPKLVVRPPGYLPFLTE